MFGKFDLTLTEPIVNNEMKYIILPFQGHSYYLRNRLQRLLILHFPDISFIFIFTNTITIDFFFQI